MTEQEQRTVFAANLNRILNASGRTQADMTRYMGVSKSTASSWCAGAKLPRMGKLDELCLWLGVMRSDLLDSPEADSEETLRRLADEKHRDDELRDVDARLNEDGHGEFIRYGRYLASRPEYRQSGPRRFVRERRYIRHYLTPAAAGFASPIEGEDYEREEVTDNVPSGADFSIDIDGDSMEPYIKNGSRVYVKRDCDVREFEDAGVFYYDGNVYCKQYCYDYSGALLLLSANPERENLNRRVSRDAASTVVCFGRVLLPRKLPKPNYG